MSYFLGLESRIPARMAEQAMQAAQVAVYPHASKDGAERLWRAWMRQAAPPRPIVAGPVPGALFSFNGQPVDIATLRAKLGGALGAGLSA